MLVSIEGAAKMLSLSRSTVYRLMDNDPEFPCPLQISKRRRALVRDELQEWIDTKRKK